MPRQLRIQYEGAVYHLMSRGNRREDIFHDDLDRKSFLQALGWEMDQRWGLRQQTDQEGSRRGQS